jgi:hypothetical protein
VDIFMNWDRFAPMFHQMGDGLGEVANGMWDLAWGVATFDAGKIVTGMNSIADGINKTLSGAVQTAIQLVTDLGNKLNSLSGGTLFSVFEAYNNKMLALGHRLFGTVDENTREGAKENKAHPDTVPDRDRYNLGNPMGDQGGSPAAPERELHVYIHADPGTEVRDVIGGAGTVIHLDNAGRVLGRI